MASRTPVQPAILLTVRELDSGGIQRDVTKIALMLDRSRFEPHVATYQIDGMRVGELIRAGVPVLHIPVSSLKSPTAFSAAIRLRRYIREHGIRLVHAYDTSAVFVVPLARASARAGCSVKHPREPGLTRPALSQTNAVD